MTRPYLSHTLSALLLAMLAAFTLGSCDDTTDSIGVSLTDDMDHLQIATDTFDVSTRSIVAGSVLSRTTTGYLGKIRDPETGAYITADFMAQFSTLEDYTFPEADHIISKIDGDIVADSCEIRLFYTDFYGDSLTTMKLTAYEMDKPMNENTNYRSDFDPKGEGLIRDGGIATTKAYTLTDLSVSETTRNSTSYTPNIRILLNEPYTDRQGVTYNNYGTYLMRKYYADPTNYKNSYNFISRVVPGFYFESKSGLGAMAYVHISQLNVYFRYLSADTIANGIASFPATEEVLQTSRIVNDEATIAALAADPTCTYLKTPAGIFTEMTLPVEDIIRGHDNDTINTARVELQRINSSYVSDYIFDIPQTLLMIPLDEMQTFFDNKQIANYKTSFLATLNSKTNSYIFGNIGGLIRHLAAKKAAGEATENWNKVVIIPVTITRNSDEELTTVLHDMSLSSTRLVGGSENPNQPVRISVIYSKFK
ncbi:MAG: DUF4270 domain-containing protein [Prevotella sp.]|nr:DUF4270 domain-containing protein [Prevotella sp.]